MPPEWKVGYDFGGLFGVCLGGQDFGVLCTRVAVKDNLGMAINKCRAPFVAPFRTFFVLARDICGQWSLKPVAAATKQGAVDRNVFSRHANECCK